jgi:hypothetical protein
MASQTKTQIKTKTQKEEDIIDKEEDEDEDEFECPRCNCVLRGDEANERRMWVSTDPEFLDPNEGYDVCDDCEEAACAEEKAKMAKRLDEEEWDSCAPMACGCCACGICHDAKREHCECPE